MHKHCQYIITNPLPVIPQVRTITRYGTRSVILFNYAESPVKNEFKRRFRTDRLTSNIPFAVRFVLRNDGNANEA